MMDRRISTMGYFWLLVMVQVALPRQAFCGCVPNTVTVEIDDCLVIGAEVVATIVLTNVSEPISGGQFFLDYSTSVFSIAPGDLQPLCNDEKL